MTSFGEWRAHAEPDRMGRGVELNIGRETAPMQWEFVTSISNRPSITTVRQVDEATDPNPKDAALYLPEPAAEALYHALHRIFGHVNQRGEIEAIKESLDKERQRVDLIVTQALGVPVRPQHKVG